MLQTRTVQHQSDAQAENPHKMTFGQITPENQGHIVGELLDIRKKCHLLFNFSHIKTEMCEVELDFMFDRTMKKLDEILDKIGRICI